MIRTVGVITIAYFTGWFGGLFGQIDPLSSWLSVIVQLGSFGLVAWLVIVGLPAMQKELQGERKAERADFAAALKEVTDFARVEVAAIRTSAKAEIEQMRAVFQQEQKETRAFHTAESALMRQLYANESTAMRQLYVDAVGAMRSAVHDVRDTASAVVNKANLAIETAKIANKT